MKTQASPQSSETIGQEYSTPGDNTCGNPNVVPLGLYSGNRLSSQPKKHTQSVNTGSCASTRKTSLRNRPTSLSGVTPEITVAWSALTSQKTRCLSPRRSRRSSKTTKSVTKEITTPRIDHHIAKTLPYSTRAKSALPTTDRTAA